MLENIIKSKPELAPIMRDAIESLHSISEPHKTKIKLAFESIDKIAESMKEYKKIDALMDDSASDLTLATGVDVRKEGVHPALARAISSSRQAQAIIDTCNWLIAKALKEYIDE